jgi:hypothetical protein
VTARRPGGTASNRPTGCPVRVQRNGKKKNVALSRPTRARWRWRTDERARRQPPAFSSAAAMIVVVVGRSRARPDGSCCCAARDARCVCPLPSPRMGLAFGLGGCGSRRPVPARPVPDLDCAPGRWWLAAQIASPEQPAAAGRHVTRARFQLNVTQIACSCNCKGGIQMHRDHHCLIFFYRNVPVRCHGTQITTL